MVSFDDFRKEWETHRVGDDSLVVLHEETNETKYQCASLVKQYVRECYGLNPGTWGNAIQWWSQTNPALLTKFTKDASGTVNKGDIVILRTLGVADFSGLGHIGIATGSGDPNSIEILEQNGMGSGTGLGADAVRTRFVPRNRLAGVLRPIPVTPTYSVTYSPTQSRDLITTKSPTNWYNLNGAFHVLTSLPYNNRFPVGGIAHWSSSTGEVHDFYMTPEDYAKAVRGDYSDNNGVSTDDLREAPQSPAPQVIATPNVSIKLAETYDVITKLMVFSSATDAKTQSNYTGTDLEPGKYYVFDKVDNAYNLSTNNVQNQNKWVRITDNVIKPVPVPEPAQPTLPVDAPATGINLPTDPSPAVPTPITDVLPTPAHQKPQYFWIREDKLPVRLTSTNSIPIPIKDLDGTYPPQQFPPHRTEDYSMFTVVSSIEYWLPDRTRNKGWMYGVPVQFLPDEEPIKPTVMDRNANGRYDIVDLFDNGLQGFIQTSSKYLDGIKQAVSTVAPKIEPAKQRIQRSIDGITKKGK